MIMFERFTDTRTGESYLTTVFKGLRVIVIPKKEFTSKFAVYATKYGSVNNKFSFGGNVYTVPAGIAHFLEHKMFEKEYGDAFTKYSATGADANAFTSFDKTAYLYSCTDNFYDSLEILTEVVNRPFFTPESVAKEQGIIGQEIQMGLDNPGNVVFYNLLKCLYSNHPIREEIAGSVESISEITADLLYTCFNAFYNPANMVLCVCGDVDENKVLEVLDKGMRDVTPEKVERLFDTEPNEINVSYMEHFAEVAKPLFEFGIKDTFKGEGIELVKHRIVCEMVFDAILGKSSKLYLDLYNAGLVNQGFGGEAMCYPDCGVLAVGGESSEPMKVYDAVKAAIENFRKTGIDQETFRLLKNKNYGYLLNGFDSVEGLAIGYMDAYFDGISHLDKLEIYRNLTLEDVNDALTYFDTDKMAVSVVLPK